jgi:hypothetical protein
MLLNRGLNASIKLNSFNVTRIYLFVVGLGSMIFVWQELLFFKL